MAKRKKKVSVTKTPGIWTLLLLLFGLVVALVSLASSTGLLSFAKPENEQNQVVTILPGVNMVGLTVRSSLTAGELCTLSDEAYQVGRWDYAGQEFVYFMCDDVLGEDFLMVPYVGYVVMSHGVETISVAGTKANPNYRLGPGWNSVVLPERGQNLATVGDLCDWKALTPKDHSIAEIDKWLNGGWDGYVCGFSFNDFELVSGEVYFLRVDSDSGAQNNAPAPTLPL